MPIMPIIEHAFKVAIYCHGIDKAKYIVSLFLKFQNDWNINTEVLQIRLP